MDVLASLDYWVVTPVDEDMDRVIPVGEPPWFAVSNPEGIVAFFRDESDALRFRLAEINRELNG